MSQVETIYNAGISINKSALLISSVRLPPGVQQQASTTASKPKKKIINQWPQQQKGYQINKAIKATSALKQSQSRLI